MRAAVLHEYGGPEVLRWEHVPDPAYGPGEVVVEVRVCGVNHCDLDSRAGVSRWELELPMVIGGEFAGVVAAVGSCVEGVAPGDPVAVLQHYREPDGRLIQFGIDRWGGYAEYVAVPAATVVPLACEDQIAVAAAGQTVASTAWRMVATLGEVGAADTVLVPSASGGVGSALVGAAKLHGARVLATVGSPAKREAVLRLGADAVACYAEVPVSEFVAAETGGVGVDCVLDAVGGPQFAEHLASLRLGGRLVTCGAHAGEVVPLDVVRLFQHGHSVIGFGFCTEVELRTALGQVLEGRLEVPIAAFYPLAEAGAAHEALDRRQHVGKLVLSAGETVAA